MSLEKSIKDEAISLGFSAVGIASTEYDAVGHDHLLQWLKKGYQAEMKYMERAHRKRFDMRTHLPYAKSVIVCAHNYYTEPADEPSRGYVSIYARGEDYHKVIRDKLRVLCKRVKELHHEFDARLFVDSAPVSERTLAVRAGIGFIGRNGMLIVPKKKEMPKSLSKGSFHFLGGIITNLELDPDMPAAGTCGKCRRCINSCPTGAIVADGVIDAARCISYHTTQNRGEIPSDIAEKMRNMVFGCDICQLVCPYNSRAIPTTEYRFAPRRNLTGIDLEALMNLTEEEFEKDFKYCCLSDIGLRMMRRNVTIALRNSGNLR